MFQEAKYHGFLPSSKDKVLIKTSTHVAVFNFCQNLFQKQTGSDDNFKWRNLKKNQKALFPSIVIFKMGKHIEYSLLEILKPGLERYAAQLITIENCFFNVS